MNAHALAVLEFPRVLGIVADRASSTLGAARVRELAPRADREWLDAEHARVAAMRALVQGDPPWHPEIIPDLTQALARLRVLGAGLDGAQLLGVATLLRSSRRTREGLADDRRPAVATAVLAPFLGRLVTDERSEQAITKVVNEDGTVRDDASPLLHRLRRELRAAQGELIRILERELSRLEEHHRVPDASITLRNGRYVIPVRRGGQVAVGGIVHDASATGGTLFVEPPAAVDFGNRIREQEAEEQREVDRILLELTDRVRPLRLALLDALDALVELDSLYARARYAIEFRCAPAELCASRDGFAIRGGRHPLLLAQGADVVPFDLAMEPDERTLLVSGPNTGGKTVLLKAVGLISALAQSGIPAPVGPESRVAVFDDIFADIGDEQSIEASLSTFSAHLKNLAEILRLASARSLVLADELGSGTDPVEGAALGGAILLELTARGALTLATTHLGALKELAAENTAVVNASLQFDAAALAPTYRLVKGIPGRSYGIMIARRLGFPEPLLERAEGRLPTGERDVSALLEELERRERALSEREAEAKLMADDARERIAEVSRREQNVRAREREVERQARRDTRRLLLDARGEIDRALKELRGAAEAAQMEEAARAARQKMEQLAGKQQEQLERLEREEAKAAARTGRAPRTEGGERPDAGDYVEVGTLGGRLGRLLEVRDGQGVVAVGAMKLTVPLRQLRRSRQEPAQERAVTLVGDLPEVYAPTEIDVRGMRADEVEGHVMQAVDDAVRADLHALRIIHGKGTGALRERVAEMLRKDSRVRNFRLGAWNEGGAGVTVVEL